MKMHKIIEDLIPDGEKYDDMSEVNCRCESRRMSIIPTRKRLMTCTSRFFGFHKVVDDFSWGTFSHVTITKKFGTYSMELKFRSKAGSLVLERITKEKFDAFYRRVRERITTYDDKFKIASKICRECGETINIVARQCPYCHTEFMPSDENPKQ